MDEVVEPDERIYICEFKLNMSAEEALTQIHQKEYYRKYALDDRSRTLAGVSFSKDTGEIAEWKTEEVRNES